MDRLSDYDYTLPPERIAQTPLEDRASSKLLWLHRNTGIVEHRRFRECPEIFDAGDVLVLNDTRVSAIRLLGQKPSGGKVEALLLREFASGTFEALMKPGRSLRSGADVLFGDLRAVVEDDLGEGRKTLRFEARPDLSQRLAARGSVPLPPYIHERLQDPERYQTVYAHAAGSAAAPTAGLHFTQEVLDALNHRGVRIAWVTLHVGIDTFRPVQVENLVEHRMHGERCEVPEATAKTLNQRSGRVIAVGTTSVRTLESFADEDGKVTSGESVSSLFIRPGYRFKVVDGMFTNFHLPKTTMLLMISALAGRERVLEAYREAVDQEYRFLSFGDSMLIL